MFLPLAFGVPAQYTPTTHWLMAVVGLLAGVGAPLVAYALGALRKGLGRNWQVPLMAGFVFLAAAPLSSDMTAGIICLGTWPLLLFVLWCAPSMPIPQTNVCLLGAGALVVLVPLLVSGLFFCSGVVDCPFLPLPGA